jgi:hypothetical protein
MRPAATFLCIPAVTTPDATITTMHTVAAEGATGEDGSAPEQLVLQQRMTRQTRLLLSTTGGRECCCAALNLFMNGWTFPNTLL